MKRYTKQGFENYLICYWDKMGRSKKWSRKKKGKQHNNSNGGAGPKNKTEDDIKKYHLTRCYNHKMESYYALQKLHDMRFDEALNKFILCETDEEKETERQKFIESLSTILPASFRLGQDVGETLRDKLENELEEFVGKEFEITVSTTRGVNVNKGRPQKKQSNIDEDDNENDKEKKNDEEMPFSNESNKEQNTKNDDNDDDDDETTTKLVAPAKRIEYIPHAYQMSVDRRTIRRNQSLEVFHRWLVRQSDAGFLTRQETVSMIPPVVLNPEPHHAVLDMCAAPGSKTSQLLEVVGVPSKEQEPKGFVVANDSDAKRAYMLVSQIKRLNSPSIFVTSADAQRFPLLRHADNKAQEGIFDRVLADVPCSGDGTARKNMGIWRHWNQGGSLALHPLQLSIVLNGARLTKVGGYVCYSTCSMNPIENEAVVAELLRCTDGALELVEKRSDLPGLIARPGWSSWTVLSESKRKKDIKNFQKKNNAKMQERRRQWADKQKKLQQQNQSKDEQNTDKDNKATTPMDVEEEEDDDDNNDTKEQETDDKEQQQQQTWVREPPSWDFDTLLERAKSHGLTHYPSFEDVPKDSQRRIRESMFPPSPEEASKFHLERCLRCLPHDMDTGGFFVALLKKVKPLSERARRLMEEELAMNANKDTQTPTVQEKRKFNDVVSTNDDDKEECKRNKTEETTKMLVDSKKEDSNANEIKDDTVEEEPPKKEEKQGRPIRDLGNENFVPLDSNLFTDIIDFYGMKEDFPKEQYMARANGDAKVIYFISNAIKTKLIDQGIQGRVTVINSGLRAFERGTKTVCESQYRPVQEAVQFIAPYMTKRKIVAEAKSFSECFAPGAIPITKFSSPAFAEEIRNLCVGAYVVALKGFENDAANKMFCVMWRCRGDNVNCLVSKKELSGMRSKINALTDMDFDYERFENYSPSAKRNQQKKEDDNEKSDIPEDNDAEESK